MVLDATSKVLRSPECRITSLAMTDCRADHDSPPCRASPVFLGMPCSAWRESWAWVWGNGQRPRGMRAFSPAQEEGLGWTSLMRLENRLISAAKHRGGPRRPARSVRVATAAWRRLVIPACCSFLSPRRSCLPGSGWPWAGGESGRTAGSSNSPSGPDSRRLGLGSGLARLAYRPDSSFSPASVSTQAIRMRSDLAGSR